MGMTTQIGRLNFNTPILDILKKKVPAQEIFLEPVANIMEGAFLGQYMVNIFTFIPSSSFLLPVTNTQSSVPVVQFPVGNENPSDKGKASTNQNDEYTGKLFIKYNGLASISTLIAKNHNQGVFCRDFDVVFEATPKKIYENPSVDMIRISFTYSLINPDNSVPAEAIFVKNANLDPETSKGTVTTTENTR